MERSASEPPANARLTLARHVSSPAGSMTAALVTVQALLAVVVVTSRMSGDRQFIAMLVMVALALAQLGAIVWLHASAERRHITATGRAEARASRGGSHSAVAGSAAALRPRPQSRRTRMPDVAHDCELGAEAALALVSELEEMPDRLRRLPLNVIVGFDEDRYIYTLVKLRAAVRSLAPGMRADAPPPGIDVAGRPGDTTAPALPEHGVDAPMEEVPAPIPAQEPEPETAMQTGTAGCSSDSADDLETDSAEQTETTNAVEGPPDGGETPVYQSSADEPLLAEQEAATPPNGQSAEMPPQAPADEEMTGVPSIEIAQEVGTARQELRAGDAAAAADRLRRALAAEPSSAEAAELLGIALEQAGDRASALSALRTATEIDPARASAHYNLAVILSKDGRADEAHLQAAIALDLKPEYAAARQFYERLGAGRN